MTDEEYSVVDQLLGCGWSSPKWDQAQSDTYRLVLDGYDGDRVLLAVQRLIQRGGAFRPSIAEVVAALDAEQAAAVPTWDEVYAAIWGPGGVSWTGRLDGVHELVALYVERRGGIDGVRREEVAHPDYRGAVLQRLKQSWEELLEQVRACEREGRALEALGRSTRGELRRPDYLAALSGEPGTGDQAAATSRLPEGRGEPARTASAGRLRRPDPLAGPDDDTSPSPPRERNPEARR
jgi:hypothetical protein